MYIAPFAQRSEIEVPAAGSQPMDWPDISLPVIAPLIEAAAYGHGLQGPVRHDPHVLDLFRAYPDQLQQALDLIGPMKDLPEVMARLCAERFMAGQPLDDLAQSLHDLGQALGHDVAFDIREVTAPMLVDPVRTGQWLTQTYRAFLALHPLSLSQTPRAVDARDAFLSDLLRLKIARPQYVGQGLAFAMQWLGADCLEKNWPEIARFDPDDLTVIKLALAYQVIRALRDFDQAQKQYPPQVVRQLAGGNEQSLMHQVASASVAMARRVKASSCRPGDPSDHVMTLCIAMRQGMEIWSGARQDQYAAASQYANPQQEIDRIKSQTLQNIHWVLDALDEKPGLISAKSRVLLRSVLVQNAPRLDAAMALDDASMDLALQVYEYGVEPSLALKVMRHALSGYFTAHPMDVQGAWTAAVHGLRLACALSGDLSPPLRTLLQKGVSRRVDFSIDDGQAARPLRRNSGGVVAHVHDVDESNITKRDSHGRTI